MDTFMSVTAYGKNCEEAAAAAIAEIQRLDALLSTGLASSEVSQVNASGSETVSEDTRAIVQEALHIYETTGGLFDFTIYPVMQLWGFTTQNYHVPSGEELERALSLVDASKVRLDNETVIVGEDQQIDLGGIAKGYTSARVMEVFREYGVTSGMVSLGGNVQVLNTKPDGSKWQIGIQDPDSIQGAVLAVTSVENKAVITSGGYERYFEEDGNTYIHIIDPRTGYPAEQGLVSVSIVSENGMLADALSTSLYIMGLDEAISYWKTYGEAFDMILITDGGDIYITEGLDGDFRTDDEVTVIHADD